MSRKIWDFDGGIHPPQNKDQSTQCAIEQPPLPRHLILPLRQHAGAAAAAIVEEGDNVLKGQKIAEAQGYVSANIHAPTSGSIKAIADHPVPHPSGLSERCIVIEPDGKDEWIEHQGVSDYQSSDRADLVTIVREAGITGLGGAGFPTSVKLRPTEESPIHTLVINAVECEPYITADDMLLRERAEEVIQGILIVRYILGPTEAIVGIEDNKPKAIAALRLAVRALSVEDKIEIAEVPTKYPSGGEKQLIQLLTGQEVPSGGIPADIGVVCQNVGTLAAIYRAVVLGEPLISRVTTVTGEAVKTQKNLDVLVGTPIQALLDYCALDEKNLGRLIMGGPMMGFSLEDTAFPIVKATNCILASTLEELPPPGPEQACIRCGMCAEACPAGLLPQQLYWYSKAKEFDKALDQNLLDCIECGACSYVCPSNIPLVQYYRYAKGEIRFQEHEHTRSEHSRVRFEARQARLDREQAEKEAKKKARAEAAAAAKAKAADGNADDPKAAVVQAALERAKSKKAEKAKAAAESEPSPKTDNEQKPHSDKQSNANNE